MTLLKKQFLAKFDFLPKKEVSYTCVCSWHTQANPLPKKSFFPEKISDTFPKMFFYPKNDFLPKEKVSHNQPKKTNCFCLLSTLKEISTQ